MLNSLQLLDLSESGVDARGGIPARQQWRPLRRQGQSWCTWASAACRRASSRARSTGCWCSGASRRVLPPTSPPPRPPPFCFAPPHPDPASSAASSPLDFCPRSMPQLHCMHPLSLQGSHLTMCFRCRHCRQRVQLSKLVLQQRANFVMHGDIANRVYG